jgi:hypothetical protein
MVKQQLAVLPYKQVHRTTWRNVVLQHVVSTFTVLCASLLCTEFSGEIWFRPLVPNLIYLYKESVGLNTMLLNQYLPLIFKLFNSKHFLNKLWNSILNSLRLLYNTPRCSLAFFMTCHLHHLCVMSGHTCSIATSIALAWSK